MNLCEQHTCSYYASIDSEMAWNVAVPRDSARVAITIRFIFGSRPQASMFGGFTNIEKSNILSITYFSPEST